MAAAGWPVVLRKSGGGACPVGPGTVQVATIEPAIDGVTMNAKYEALRNLIQSALHFYGVCAQTGTVAHAYCPGGYDLAIHDKKIAGMSQHWFRNRGGIRCVITTASINIEEEPAVLADVVNRFYSGAGSLARCLPAFLTSLRLSGGATAVATPDLAPAFMKRLASFAGWHGDVASHFSVNSGPPSPLSLTRHN